MSGPTQGAREGAVTTWAASPVLARLVRVVLFVVPIAVGWLAVRLVNQWFWTPRGLAGFLAWFFQATALGGVVATVVDRQTRHFLPLATLLGMSLTFPDEAPSRFGIALRTGTVRKLEQRLADFAEHGISNDEATAATEAIELITMLGKHERLTRGHTERVRAYAELIAAEMGVSEADRQKLAWAVLLHDIGKLTVPAEILNKNGRPTEAEWAILRNHPAAGEAFVAPLADWLGSWRFATSQHHERWDGTGYPKGIGGERISLAGRITAVADAYDVITSKRSYKSPISHDDARKELVACSGTQFDPAVVRAFLEISLEDRRSAGFLSGLLELPALANIGAGVSAAPAIAVVTVAALAGAVAVDSPAVPLALAAPTTIMTTSIPDAAPGPDPARDLSASSSTVLPFAVPTSFVVPTTEAEATTTTAPATTAPPTTAPPTTAPTTAPPTTAAPTTTSSPPSDGPDASDDVANIAEGKNRKINILDNDGPGQSGSPLDETTLRIAIEPTNGTVRIDEDHVHYRSDDDYEGIDSFVYEICDEGGGCSTAIVTVTVEDD